MKSFTNAILLACVSLLIASCLSSTAGVNAQSAAVTAGAAGTSSSLTGVVYTQAAFSASTAGRIYPWYATAAQLASMGADSNYCLVSRTTGTTMYNIIWNFTSSESSTIQTWLGTLPQRNNLEVAFSATWNDEGRFTVDPSTWTMTQDSLFPYGVGSDCNATAMIACLVTLENSLPGDCQNQIIPLVRSCAVGYPACLALYGKSVSLVHSYCTQQRGVIDTLFCTDGKAGGDAACAFVNENRPSGEYSTSLVLTVDADGNPTSGSNGAANPPPSPASAGSLMMVSVVVGLLASIVTMMI